MAIKIKTKSLKKKPGDIYFKQSVKTLETQRNTEQKYKNCEIWTKVSEAGQIYDLKITQEKFIKNDKLG